MSDPRDQAIDKAMHALAESLFNQPMSELKAGAYEDVFDAARAAYDAIAPILREQIAQEIEDVLDTTVEHVSLERLNALHVAAAIVRERASDHQGQHQGQRVGRADGSRRHVGGQGVRPPQAAGVQPTTPLEKRDASERRSEASHSLWGFLQAQSRSIDSAVGSETRAELAAGEPEVHATMRTIIPARADNQPAEPGTWRYVTFSREAAGRRAFSVWTRYRSDRASFNAGCPKATP